MKSLVPTALWHQLRERYLQSKDSYYSFLASRLHALKNDDKDGFSYLLEQQPYNTETIIHGYMQGQFPSSIHGDGVITWQCPEPRGVLPIYEFHVPKDVRRILRQERFEVRVDVAFAEVMEACGEGRARTHITPRLISQYEELHQMGIAHAMSVWEDGQLVGGGYGLAIGGYFVGESAFHRVSDSGKVMMVRLTEILAAGGFVLHDTWWPSRHLEQFRGHGIPRSEFLRQHARAIITQAKFDANAPRSISTGYVTPDEFRQKYGVQRATGKSEIQMELLTGEFQRVADDTP
jgi:leucyl/phenylalanyl-tRNA--protein transferase